ncbi:DDE-domain-containing protein, partial [Schizopora paradoxa]
MDESGFQLSFQTKKRVVGRKGAKIQHKQGASDRENVTVLVTICADGSRLHPTIIFKGANFMTKWSNNNVANASFCHSTNGWIDTELAVAWFLNDFLPTIRAKSGNEPVFVFVDSQVTHLSLKLLRTAAENNVQFLAYPTRATHALQGLDVVCFAPMKDLYHEEVKKFTDLHGRKVSKGDFAAVFGTAYLRAFTEDLIKAAFRATGIYPFNPSAISTSQMKPSEPTSIQGSFPTEQPSPVKAVAKAFRDKPLTRLDIEDFASTGNETFSMQEDDAGALTEEQGGHDLRPQSPTLVIPQQRDSGSEEPAARMRILALNLARTKSGAYLVSKDDVRASQPVPSLLMPSMAALPEPDWSILRKKLPVNATQEEIIAH